MSGLLKYVMAGAWVVLFFHIVSIGWLARHLRRRHAAVWRELGYPAGNRGLNELRTIRYVMRGNHLALRDARLDRLAGIVKWGFVILVAAAVLWLTLLVSWLVTVFGH